jgi:hypothetical protein
MCNWLSQFNDEQTKVSEVKPHDWVWQAVHGGTRLQSRPCSLNWDILELSLQRGAGLGCGHHKETSLSSCQSTEWWSRTCQATNYTAQDDQVWAVEHQLDWGNRECSPATRGKPKGPPVLFCRGDSLPTNPHQPQQAKLSSSGGSVPFRA